MSTESRGWCDPCGRLSGKWIAEGKGKGNKLPEYLDRVLALRAEDMLVSSQEWVCSQTQKGGNTGFYKLVLLYKDELFVSPGHFISCTAGVGLLRKTNIHTLVQLRNAAERMQKPWQRREP